MEARLIFSV